MFLAKILLVLLIATPAWSVFSADTLVWTRISNKESKKQSQHEDYRTWKKEIEEEWEELEYSLPDRLADLLITHNLLEFSKESVNSAVGVKILYAYNLLRELSNMPVVSNLSEIDEDWIRMLEQSIDIQKFNALNYEAWKKYMAAVFEDESDFNEQARDMADNALFYLKKLERMSNDAYYEKASLYCYNFLRELLNKSVADSINAVDKKWITEVGKAADYFEPYSVKDYPVAVPELKQEDVCAGAEAFYDPEEEKVSNGALDFIAAFEGWRKSEEKKSDEEQRYIDWKNRKINELLVKIEYTHFLKNDLFEHIEVAKTSMSESVAKTLEELGIKPNSAYHREQILFSYNALRELYGQPLASSIEDIDKNWLDLVYYEHRKEVKVREWKQNGYTTRNKQVADLLLSTHTLLFVLGRNPVVDSYIQSQALFSYNFLREAFNQPQVTSVSEVDRTWLMLVEYENWKEAREEEWQRDGYSKINKELYLLNLILNSSKVLAGISEPAESLPVLNLQQNIIFAYNVLREMYNQPIVSSFKDIDSNWLDAIGSRSGEEETVQVSYAMQTNTSSTYR
jgi:ABC-type transporter lipoprotein component MlaA